MLKKQSCYFPPKFFPWKVSCDAFQKFAAKTCLWLSCYSTDTGPCCLCCYLFFFSTSSAKRHSFLLFSLLFSVQIYDHSRIVFYSRVGLACELCGNANSVIIFWRQHRFSFCGKSSHSYEFLRVSMWSCLWLKLVDLLLVSFNGKKYSPESGLAWLKFPMVPSYFWITWPSGRNQVPSENRGGRVCLRGNAESRSAANTARLFFDHYSITRCRRSIAAWGAWYLSPSQHCSLGLSLTLCLGACIWRARSALDRKATGFKTLFVHFDYRSSLNELIKA